MAYNKVNNRDGGDRKTLILANVHFHLCTAITDSGSTGMTVLPPFPCTISCFIQTRKKKNIIEWAHRGEQRRAHYENERKRKEKSKSGFLFSSQRAANTQIQKSQNWMTFGEFNTKKPLQKKKLNKLRRRNRHEERNWFRNRPTVSC